MCGGQLDFLGSSTCMDQEKKAEVMYIAGKCLTCGKYVQLIVSDNETRPHFFFSLRPEK